jgi:hypothetical protein
LAVSINDFSGKVRLTISEIANVVHKLNVASCALFDATQISNTNVSKQKSDAEQFTISIGQLNQGV